MDQNNILSELERTATALGIDVRYEPMQGLVQGVGGVCRVKGNYRVIVDKRFKTPERVQILVDVLRRFDTDGLAVSPRVRKLIAPLSTPADSGSPPASAPAQGETAAASIEPAAPRGD